MWGEGGLELVIFLAKILNEKKNIYFFSCVFYFFSGGERGEV